jgi:site-specific DNA-adenine methylase
LNYEGGKGGSGVYQQIINLMPAHGVYIETHLGGGNILLRKRPAPRGSIAIEIDSVSLNDFQLSLSKAQLDFLIKADVRFLNGDCLEYLRNYRWTGKELVYADPPYLMSTRRTQKARYRYEYTEDDHRELISMLLEVPAAVMISGYCSDLYDEVLSRWHTHEFSAPTRRGRATEKLWMNFEPDSVLKHEYTYAGDNYRERERIKKKVKRWVSNLAVLPEGERNFILQEIERKFRREFHHHSTPRSVPDPAASIMASVSASSPDVDRKSVV